ncbi:Tn3 family transposase [Streptosporangium carneum]|uniref:Tn3 family transposase n=1 Tax=Streptosporangium carneum TaxID=47481 RepID=UPI0034D9838B
MDQGYLRGETITAANARLIAAQAELDIVKCWGGGHIASADGLRFVVPGAESAHRAQPDLLWPPARRDLAGRWARCAPTT